MSADRPIASTPLGRLLGTVVPVAVGPVCVWRGIRYAEAERFGAPAPPAPWDDIEPAVAFGPSCPQLIPGIKLPLGGGEGHADERCLVLNVFSPAADGARRPVLVWIHGGAFVLGSADLYDAAHLAATGDIVVVTVNYRLGVLGFLDLGGALGDPAVPGNLGLRDQIAALRWVRDSIAAFGGDPGRVTLAGESAGAVSVSMLMVCPEAAGLFHGAVLQSGALSIAHEAAPARMMATRFLDLLELERPDLAALRALPVHRLLQAQHALNAEFPGRLPSLPWYDGVLLPATLAEAERTPTPPVPLLAGSNRDEYRTFEILPGGRKASRRAELAGRLGYGLPREAADRILDAYPADRAGCRQLATDLFFAMPTHHFAAAHAARHGDAAPCWLYRFDVAHPLLEAGHGLELLYLFEMDGLVATVLRGGRLTGSRGALADRMRAHWIGFVRSGAPGADWPRFEAPRRATLLFDHVDRVVHDPEAPRRLAWNAHSVISGGIPIET